MEDNRTRRALPLVLIFLAAVGVFSFETSNPWWFIVACAGTVTIFLVRRLRGGEE